MTTAIVLSGGGAKGDFELGALRYLYDQGIRPDILCGTSVGSINAAKLAEGEDPGDPHQGLPGLEAIWAQMVNTSDMVSREAWLSDPDMDSRIEQLLLGWRSMSDSGFAQPSLAFDPFGILSTIAAVEDAVAIAKSLQVVLAQARGIYNLGPIAERIRTSLDPAKVAAWAAGGKHLRLAMVALESGRLRYAAEPTKGDLCSILQRDGTPLAEVPASACANERRHLDQLNGMLAKLESQLQALSPGGPAPTPIGSPLGGGETYPAQTSTSSQRVSLMAQIGVVLTQIDAARSALKSCMSTHPPVPVSAPLTDCVLASAGIPVFFLPQTIGSESCVDGGVREVLPLQAAMDLGADTIFAISVSLPVSAADSVASSHLLDIASRVSLEIMTDEVVRDDFLARSSGATQPKVTLIQPEFDVHSYLVIDPGLIQIARDYGYMMAADALAPDIPAAAKGSATAIARLRTSIWERENQYEGKVDAAYAVAPIGISHDQQSANNIAQMKSSLAAMLETRTSNGLAVPPGINRFTGESELHAWQYDDALMKAQQTSPDVWTVTATNAGRATWWPDDTGLVLQSGTDASWLQAVPAKVRPGESHTFEAGAIPVNAAFRMARRYASTGPKNVFGREDTRVTVTPGILHGGPTAPR